MLYWVLEVRRNDFTLFSTPPRTRVDGMCVIALAYGLYFDTVCFREQPFPVLETFIAVVYCCLSVSVESRFGNKTVFEAAERKQHRALTACSRGYSGKKRF